MNILFVTSECAPFSKSGGLAEVAFSLPPQLKKRMAFCTFPSPTANWRYFLLPATARTPI